MSNKTLNNIKNHKILNYLLTCGLGRWLLVNILKCIIKINRIIIATIITILTMNNHKLMIVNHHNNILVI